MQAIILAGGKGKRLKSLTKTIPKPLIQLNNKPLIDRILDHVKQYGVNNVIMCTGYLAEKIMSHLNAKNYGVMISESQESKPLGTAGPLHLIKNRLDKEFFVLYGDVYITVNLKKMLDFHHQQNADVTLALHSSDHPQDSTVVTIDNNEMITSFVEKPGEKWKKYGNLTSAALYVVKKDIIKFIREGRVVDFARDVFPQMLKNGKKLYGYVTDEYAKDIGTPKRYEEVNRAITRLEDGR